MGTIKMTSKVRSLTASDLEKIGWNPTPYGAKIVSPDEPGSVFIRLDPGRDTAAGQPEGNIVRVLRKAGGEELLRKHETTKSELVEVMKGYVDYISLVDGKLTKTTFGPCDYFTSIAGDPERTGNLHTIRCNGTTSAILCIKAVPLEIKTEKRK